jgi:soluble lytic murein transglycosylase-like protein
MRHLLDVFKEDVKLALAAYNWGMGNVRKNLDPDSWPSETRRYVEKIVAALG